MSRADVRAAATAFFGGVPGLSTVFSSYPKEILAMDYTATLPPGATSGAVGVVFIGRDDEYRRSPGPLPAAGKRAVVHQVRLELYLASAAQRAEDAMADFDGIIEAVRARMRTDRNLGDVAHIFSSFEGDHESDPGVRAEYGEPFLAGDLTCMWASLAFPVHEQWITA